MDIPEDFRKLLHQSPVKNMDNLVCPLFTYLAFEVTVCVNETSAIMH